ncbi:AMP-binding protein [Streptomyces sp. SID8361]|uniref:class I adenylate-forming enzyme family protein n=1 Tax=Streptomyces TaxID=1883 RepID=UPI00081E2E7E|nr:MULTISPECIES: long-chain fatty acid--CoA ligase [unclassified Streptomyces]MCD9587564.1 long-chain fatty acid--CoA ligase [Streptomyces sp. 8ZJF_21]MCM3808733.1 long-chain fatty acid--CoA ligase [Streptomyces sp. DR7-3]MYU13088.1 AMP-binding protein [Streptomyces sp. SID8361]SCF97865.1 Acyl-CoA synthetase (AMP-forming)/AMP-acid ligase II [Streptomyces sp. MnatMP-M27]
MDTLAGASGHRSPRDAEPIPAPFPQAVIDAFHARPELPAFEHRSRVLSRGEVLELIGRCADGLRAAGLGPGRSVAVATDVTPEGFAVLMAAYLLGCRVTGLRPGMTPAHLGYVLSDGIDVLVADETGATPELLDAAREVTVVRLGPDLLDAHPKATGELTAQGRPEDIAMVTLTSGSTGQPKGCTQTYRSLALNWAWQPARWTEGTARLAARYERYLLFGTLTSAVIFEHLGACLMGGGTAVIPEPPLAFPQVFERHRITACLMTVPRLHHVLDVLRTDRVDTSSLRALLVAGSPLAPHRLAEAARRLGPVVHQGYGQTETGMLTLLTPDHMAQWPDQVYDSVGRAWSGVELDVRDPEGRSVPAGTTGEIWVRTDSAMAGYWKDEEQTREVLRAGWVRTRDVGHLDEHGFLRLTGRARDVVIINAIVHYAGAIERALAAHPDVDQAYVVGAPDERTGEAAHAFVVPAEGREPDLDAVRALVAAELGEASVPATVTVVTEVPVAPSGKPDKRALLSRVTGPLETA